MSLIHCLTLGTRAVAVTFPDSETEPVAEYVASLLDAATAVAHLTSKEHEIADAFHGHVAGGMTAVEVLTGLAAALMQEITHNRTTAKHAIEAASDVGDAA